MSISKLAFKNIFRHRTRSILSIIGIAASITVLFSIISITKGFEKGLERELQNTEIEFVVAPSGCPHEVASLLFYGAVPSSFLDESIAEEVRKIQGVDIATPMVILHIPTPEKKGKVLVYGYDMEHLKKIKPLWKIKGDIPRGADEAAGIIGYKKEYGVIIGSDIAEKERVNIGDRLVYPNAGMALIVSGILEKTYGKDDVFIYAPLSTAQALVKNVTGFEVVEIESGQCCALTEKLTDDPISAIAVKLEDPNSMMKVTEELTEKIPGIQIIPVALAIKSVSAFAASARTLGLSIAIIALLISAAGVMNSILMAVFERTQEIGMMRAIGASRSDIFRMTVTEAAIMTVIGGISGIALTTLGSSFIEWLIRGITPYIMGEDLITFEPTLATLCLILSVVIGIFAGIYPAWRASRVSPIEAIRSL